jgi:hypothetical protein
MTLSVLIGQNEEDIINIKKIRDIVSASQDDSDLQLWVNNIYSLLTDTYQFTSDNIQIYSEA